jgi:hypothetical protein
LIKKWLEQKDIIDFDRLVSLLGFDNYYDLKDARSRWLDSEMQNDSRGNKTSGHKTLQSAVKRLLWQ